MPITFNPEDVKALYEAINKDVTAIDNCVATISNKLGLDNNRVNSILSLAKSLHQSRLYVKEAKASLQQINLRRDQKQQQIASLKNHHGLDHDNLDKPNNDGFAIDYKAHVEGHGPQGGFGEGFSLRSPQQRAAQKAALIKEQSLKDYYSAKDNKLKQDPKLNLNDNQALNNEPSVIETSANSDESRVGSFDGRKKIDHTSKLDYSNQQEDLELIHKGGIGYNTKIQSPIKDNFIKEQALLYQEQSTWYLAKAKEFKDYANYLAKTCLAQKFDKYRDSQQSTGFSDKYKVITSIISDIEIMKENKIKGRPIQTNVSNIDLSDILKKSPVGNSIYNEQKSDSKLDNNLNEKSDDHFALNNQGVHGYDVNDYRHEGAKIASSLSLTNNDKSVDIEDSIELSHDHDTKAVKEDAVTYESTQDLVDDNKIKVSDKAKPFASDLNKDTLDDNNASYEDNTTPFTSFDNNHTASENISLKVANESDHKLIGANSLALDPSLKAQFDSKEVNEQANIALNSLAQTLGSSEGIGDDFSIDDILGSSLVNEPEISHLEPQGVSDINDESSNLPSGDYSITTGGSSSTPKQDLNDNLPPWSMGTVHKRVFEAPLANDDLPQASFINLNPNELGKIDKIDDHKVDALNANNDSAHDNEDLEGVKNSAHGSMVISQDHIQESSESISLNTQHQDSLITDNKSALKRIDGSYDLSEQENRVKQEIENLNNLNNSILNAHSSEEKAKLNQQKSLLALSVLDSIDQKVSKDVELSEANGPSPWSLLNQAQVLSVNGHNIKINHPEPIILTKRNDNSIATSIDSDIGNNKVVIVTDMLKIRDDGFIKQLSVTEFLNKVPELLKAEGQFKEEQQKDKENVLLHKQDMISNGFVFHEHSNDLMELLAISNSALKQELLTRQKEDLTNDHKAIPLCVFGQGALKVDSKLLPWDQMILNAPQVHFDNQSSNISLPKQSSAQKLKQSEHNIDKNFDNKDLCATNSKPVENVKSATNNIALSNNKDRPDYIADHDDLYNNVDIFENSIVAIEPSFDETNSLDDEDDYPISDLNGNYDLMADSDVATFDNDNNSSDNKFINTALIKVDNIANMRPMSDDDFYEEILEQDEWLATIYKAFPTKGPEYSLLTRTVRKIDDNDMQHWTIIVSKDNEFDFFLPSIIKGFNDISEQKLTIDVQKENDTPREAPCYKAYFAHQKAIAMARQKISQVRGINHLIKNLGLDVANVPLELYVNNKTTKTVKAIASTSLI